MELEHSHWEKSQSCSPMSVLCCVTCHLFCHLTKYTVAGTALGPISTLGMPATGPGAPRALFPQDHQRRSTRVRSQDHIHHLSGAQRKLQRQPSPVPKCTCPQSLWLLRPHPFQPWTHPVSTLRSSRHWIYKASGRGVRLWLAQPQG